ncbi:hypothetical protein [Actinomadura macra]|nr:hypothetical protein [Actinomadura macra]
MASTKASFAALARVRSPLVAAMASASPMESRAGPVTPSGIASV